MSLACVVGLCQQPYYTRLSGLGARRCTPSTPCVHPQKDNLITEVGYSDLRPARLASHPRRDLQVGGHAIRGRAPPNQVPRRGALDSPRSPCFSVAMAQTILQSHVFHRNVYVCVRRPRLEQLHTQVRLPADPGCHDAGVVEAALVDIVPAPAPH